MSKNDRQRSEHRDPEHVARPDDLLQAAPEPETAAPEPEAPPPLASAPEPEDDTLPIGVYSMDSAPQDGRFLFLGVKDKKTGKYAWRECYWYKTRHMHQRQWAPTGWWCERGVPRVQILFAPEVWTDEMPDGAVSAAK